MLLHEWKHAIGGRVNVLMSMYGHSDIHTSHQLMWV